MTMNWSRLLCFLLGSVTWALMDMLSGKPANVELWMLAGLVMSWLYESRTKQAPN